jgi:AcrR family transcriptional regulator
MKAKAGRPYSSPLRAEQAAATRDRIVDATVALLQDNDVSAFSMQDVADRAGVALRTAYRAFPTKDDLISGVLDAAEERFEAAAGGPPPTTPAGLRAHAGPAVRAVFELEPLYRALFATASGRELHARMGEGRLAATEGAFAEELSGLTDAQRQQFAGVAYLVMSSRGVLFLKDYAGLDVEAATSAVSWALDVLVAALRDPQLRARLGDMDEGAG